MSLYQLSAETKIPSTTLRHYINGDHYPSGNRLDVISRALRVKPRDLVYGDQNG